MIIIKRRMCVFFLYHEMKNASTYHKEKSLFISVLLVFCF